jgi:hypothetical protein
LNREVQVGTFEMPSGFLLPGEGGRHAHQHLHPAPVTEI